MSFRTCTASLLCIASASALQGYHPRGGVLPLAVIVGCRAAVHAVSGFDPEQRHGGLRHVRGREYQAQGERDAGNGQVHEKSLSRRLT